MKTLRNVAIIAALAAVVWQVPAGGRGATVVGAVLALLFGLGLALFAGRMYREQRLFLYGLGDRYRALLYGALAVGFLTFAATARLMLTGIGTLVWVALLCAVAAALFAVYRYSRTY